MIDRMTISNHKPENRNVGRLHALIFSFNVAVGFVLALVFGYDGVFVPILRLERLIYSGWGVTAGDGAVSGYVAFLLCVLAVAGLLFLLLWWFERASVRRHVLVYVGGFAALSVAPLCWVYIESQHGSRWQLVEAAAFLFLAVVYLLRRRALSTRLSVVAACIHYGFWSALFWKYESSPLEMLVPLIGLCSCISWGRYLSTERV